MAEYVPHADIPRGISEAYYAGMTLDRERLRADVDAALARARDTALHGLKVVEAITASELLVSNDPSETIRAKGANLFPGVGAQPNVPAAPGS